MDNNGIVTYSRNLKNPEEKQDSEKNINQLNQNHQIGSRDELNTNGQLVVGVVQVQALINITQLTPEQIQNLVLNIRTINFLQILNVYTKLKIICNKVSCAVGCRSHRSHQVIGINEQGQENLLMTASQEELQSDSQGYMLVYKSPDNVIFGTLGYQYNPKSQCCGCNCAGCCVGCGGCEGCCKKQEPCCSCCTGCCSCCEDCCKNGGCCKGGCCTERGCCCFCEDGCCIGGCCTFCNCCCFEGGCCNEPCFKDGCCPCPEYQNILLDVRLLNTIEEALTIEAGLYVSTLYSPINCCGCSEQYIGYKKCGERFVLEKKCLAYNEIQLGIINLETKQQVGNAKQNKSFCGPVESYEVDLPKESFPLEKLLIISEIFMFVFLKWDEGGNDQMIITKKRKIFPGLEPNFA